MWGLPEVFDLVDDDDSSTRRVSDNICDEEIEEDPHVELELVEGYKDWRKVRKGESVYYFNVVTRQTAWSLQE